ncbi:MAG: NnrU family protein [Burkholderiales bacterium]|nr:NnrU family protein [Burkholderiales bacterium]
MAILILGLAIFLGSHSVRIYADDWRCAIRARLGEHAWKGAYSLISLAGFSLIIWGFALARQTSPMLLATPLAMRHAAALLTAPAFVLLAATYVPKNGIKAALHHPMLLGVQLWALAHLLTNGKLADLVLFGSFLAWAIAGYRAARKRDSLAGTTYPAGTMPATLITLALGLAAWIAFAFWLHGLLTGVRPFG